MIHHLRNLVWKPSVGKAPSFFCGITLTVLTYSTFSYVTSTPIIPNHSLLSVTDLVNVATFTHCKACLFTAVTYNKI